MANKTFIELINLVGVNMRRSDGSFYTTVDQNQDAVFIGFALNEAKRMVEDNWNLDQITRDITFDSVANQSEYDTSLLSVVSSDPIVTTDRSRIKRDHHGRLQMWDVTTGGEARMIERSREWVDNARTLVTQSATRPSLVAIYPNEAGLVVKFPYPPNAIRSYSFKCIVPQDELTLSSDELEVPFRPVVLAATALAAEERGEELGLTASRWWEQYENAFGNMVARDSLESDFTLIADTFDYIHNSWPGI